MDPLLPLHYTLENEHTVGHPILSPIFWSLKYIKFDGQSRIFAVSDPSKQAETHIFDISQVERIVRFNNYAVAYRQVPRCIPGGLAAFAKAWNSERALDISIVNRNNGRVEWAIPNTPIPKELISFPNYNDFGHFIDPRLNRIGAYEVDQSVVSNSFIDQVARLLLHRASPESQTPTTEDEQGKTDSSDEEDEDGYETADDEHLPLSPCDTEPILNEECKMDEYERSSLTSAYWDMQEVLTQEVPNDPPLNDSRFGVEGVDEGETREDEVGGVSEAPSSCVALVVRRKPYRAQTESVAESSSGITGGKRKGEYILGTETLKRLKRSHVYPEKRQGRNRRVRLT